MIGRTVAWILRRCGDDITLAEGKNRRLVRAVVQPMSQRSDEMRLPTAVGQMDEGRYLYLGPPQQEIFPRKTAVLWQGRRYAVMSSHPIYVEGAISHWWGVLVREEGVD